jgi:hypothetical protein
MKLSKTFKRLKLLGFAIFLLQDWFNPRPMRSSRMNHITPFRSLMPMLCPWRTISPTFNVIGSAPLSQTHPDPAVTPSNCPFSRVCQCALAKVVNMTLRIVIPFSGINRIGSAADELVRGYVDALSQGPVFPTGSPSPSKVSLDSKPLDCDRRG